jgi:uncharacterized protein (DUF1778 family)
MVPQDNRKSRPRMLATNEKGRAFQWNVPETIAGRGTIGRGAAGRHAVAPEVREADIRVLTRCEPVLTVRERACVVRRVLGFVMTRALRRASVLRKEAPMPSPTSTARRETLNLRIKPEDRGLIDRAAQLTGKTKTDFVLEAARRAAEDALLERTLFLAGPAAFEAFRTRLDEPPHPNDRLRRTLQTPAPWE